jgi:hypothetical protein
MYVHISVDCKILCMNLNVQSMLLQSCNSASNRKWLNMTCVNTFKLMFVLLN